MATVVSFKCQKKCCSFSELTQTHTFSKRTEPSKRRESAGIAILRIENNIVKVLLTQSYNASWGIPKGKQESGESLKQCACREVMEETNIEIPEDKLNNKLKITFVPRYDKNLTIHVFFYFMTEVDALVWALEKTNINSLHFDSTGLGWASLRCLSASKLPIKLNCLTRFVVKKVSAATTTSELTLVLQTHRRRATEKRNKENERSEIERREMSAGRI